MCALGPPVQRQCGLGMIEVLVALLVFAVGLTGMAAVQLAAGRHSLESGQRSFATGLASDILERMRSNPGALLHYAGAELGAGEQAFAAACDRQPCDARRLAARDLYEWDQLLRGYPGQLVLAGAARSAGGLVDGRVCIDVEDGLARVAVAWRGAQRDRSPADAGCGEGSGLYGPRDRHRRLVLLSSHIGSNPV